MLGRRKVALAELISDLNQSGRERAIQWADGHKPEAEESSADLYRQHLASILASTPAAQVPMVGGTVASGAWTGSQVALTYRDEQVWLGRRPNS